MAARRGDLAAAVKQGQDALAIDRRSQPSLLMVGSELDEVLQDRYPDETDTREFHESLVAATRA